MSTRELAESAQPQQPRFYHCWKNTAFFFHWVLWKIQQFRQILWPYRHWWELQSGFWIPSPGCSPKSLVMSIGSFGTPLSPWVFTSPGWECLCVPLFKAAFQRGSSLSEWQGAGKQHLFVSFSDNGKCISLHPFLGIALRQTKNSFPSSWRRGAGSAQRRGCPEVGISDWGSLCSWSQGWQLSLHTPHPCSWCQTPPALGLFGFNLQLVHLQHLVLHQVSQAAWYLAQGFLYTHFCIP